MAPPDSVPAAEQTVVRPDGTGKVSLTQLVAAPGSGVAIADAQWTRVSDTVYLKESDAASGSTKSINFIEIDSLSQTTVNANGVFGFANVVYLTE